MVDQQKLQEILRSSWARTTSADPASWTPENPSWGQCAVTALVVQDYLGGDVLWAEAVLPDGRTISHYFNELNGEEKDFSRE